MNRIWNYLKFERSPGAILELDGLRGIAILLVLCRHAVEPFYRHDAPGLSLFGYDLMIPMRNGWMGVDLFFVLSGFLVTHHVLKRWGDSFSWSKLGEYMTKRFLRIVPTYYAFLFFVAAGLAPLYSFPREDLGRQLVQHVLFLQDYYPAQIVVAFWSLGVEEKFYLCVPFLVVGLARVPDVRRRIRWLVILATIPMVWRLLTYVNHVGPLDYATCFWSMRSPFHLAVDSLLIGAVCGYLFRHRDEFPALARPAVCRAMFLGGAAVVGWLLCGGELLARIGWFNATLMFPLLAIGFAAMLLSLVLRREAWSRMFASRWLFFFSKISYSLYLVHMVFIGSTYYLLAHMPGFLNLSRGGQLLVYLPVYTIVSVAGALVLHYLVEKPSLAVKDHWANWPFTKISRNALASG